LEEEMNIDKIIEKGTYIAVVSSDDVIINDVQSALDLIMTVKYDTGAERIVINKGAVAEEFFILSSGLAGEILQKFINYHVKFAVYGDYSKYTSKPLRDFIYESNCRKDIFFVSTKDEAIQKLRTI
jgi:hypothetical protein